MEACKELKEKYDRCFNDWFSEKFLHGINDDSECAPLLKVYTKCVAQAMKDQNINLDEVNVAHLGTEQEKKTEN
ncbi:TP53-regulated inhibitor of apoptosis 1-like isoform X2 [Bombus vosnesenskii]|uniref:TP53-regulated inhibitor of apoptosis 1-like isoform X2 n=2 Tax=Pyrobombus TaxID=144703 RepID=A0A6J3K5D1_9HYME|nr:TP53-regulated inhibitor of apoptosis 1-like isoform X2 [Bombus vancouverensis nearcticus]XP_033320259.1 TP53-regulated inhibitor of apoptosis 1-like isoform X2 [Bombus bifarius]XP_033347790.1 TP53-regulated inhibitor of apoptosis 1-like isoform X2 [Bombus vosnesenskii]XP_050487139.1 TP53-regulated inhibitor of apoptosis 1-like [Bombus huntii]